MAGLDTPKLFARNVAALRRFLPPDANGALQVAGNPVSTRLESGVGNCFPGLECDLRNLERRFIPHAEVDFRAYGTPDGQVFTLIELLSIDRAGVQQAANENSLDQAAAAIYLGLADDLDAQRQVVGVGLSGAFGVLGQLQLELTELNGVSSGPGRNPPDTWTAVRLLTEGTPVSIVFLILGTEQVRTLTTTRARYLDDNGALSAAFLPGELTQSLCSPWTHDFRDCGCYYWASNHPDIVQPLYPNATPPADPQPWTTEVAWQRADRQVRPVPPPAASATAPSAELRHYEINRRWQELHLVVNRREITTPYKPNDLHGTPLPDRATLLAHLRYAAGVELAVAHEYLSAAYSLKADTDASLGVVGGLRDDVRATRAELMRIGIGEMRHTRAVNDVIRALSDPGTYTPALRVARLLPEIVPGIERPVTPKAANRAAIEDFIAIEAPSAGVDGLYFDILATLESPPPDVAALAADEWREAISSVIAEGEDHYQTFLDIKEWLSAYGEVAYLRTVSPQVPQPGQADHVALQVAYRALLENLYAGYEKGRFPGAGEINAARASMVVTLDPLAHAVADKGLLVTFDVIPDARFAPIDPPPTI